jgi:hypothetical protein
VAFAADPKHDRKIRDYDFWRTRFAESGGGMHGTGTIAIPLCRTPSAVMPSRK